MKSIPFIYYSVIDDPFIYKTKIQNKHTYINFEPCYVKLCYNHRNICQ